MITLYDLYDDQNKFLMRAPLGVVASVLKLQPAAVSRVKSECAPEGGVCQLHANGRDQLGGKYCIVQRAVGLLFWDLKGK